MWKAICEVIQEASSSVKNNPVRAIGVAVLGEAITPIDVHLQPLYNTLPSVGRSLPGAGRLVAA